MPDKALLLTNFEWRVRRFKQINFRLEDDVLVTPDGARRLGPNRLPIAPDDIETVMNQE